MQALDRLLELQPFSPGGLELSLIGAVLAGGSLESEFDLLPGLEQLTLEARVLLLEPAHDPPAAPLQLALELPAVLRQGLLPPLCVLQLQSQSLLAGLGVGQLEFQLPLLLGLSLRRVQHLDFLLLLLQLLAQLVVADLQLLYPKPLLPEFADILPLHLQLPEFPCRVFRGHSNSSSKDYHRSRAEEVAGHEEGQLARHAVQVRALEGLARDPPLEPGQGGGQGLEGRGLGAGLGLAGCEGQGLAGQAGLLLDQLEAGQGGDRGPGQGPAVGLPGQQPGAGGGQARGGGQSGW